MKNALWKILPCYILGLAVMGLTAWVATRCYSLIPIQAENAWWIGIAAAIMFCVLAIVSHKLAKGRAFGYIVGYLFNAIGSGLCIGMLYWEMDWSVSTQTLALALFPSVTLGFLLCLTTLKQNKIWRKVCDSTILLLTIALIVAAIITWIKWDHVGGSFAFFCGVCQLFFHIACLVIMGKLDGKWRYLSFSGFWAFAIIAILVFIILSEGDILDGLDFDIGGSGKRNKANKKT